LPIGDPDKAVYFGSIGTARVQAPVLVVAAVVAAAVVVVAKNIDHYKSSMTA
jgi:hypothetical protein